MELDKDSLARLIREVVEEYVGSQPSATPPAKSRDASGVIKVDPVGFALEPFPFPIDAPPGSVRLVDVLTLEESPRLGCGLMEVENTSFEWTLTYDEVDYVIDGTLDLIMDGRTVRATAGQILFVPKNTKLRFSSPDKARFVYIVYPANWAD